MKINLFLLVLLIVIQNTVTGQITWANEPEDFTIICDTDGSASDEINNYLNSLSASADDSNCSPITIVTDFIAMDYTCGEEVDVYLEVIDKCSNSINTTITISVENDLPFWIGNTNDFLPQDITVFVSEPGESFVFPNGYFEDFQNNISWPIYPPLQGSEFDDDCGDVNFSVIGFPPTSAFPEGENDISYIIEDECSQVGHNFTVTVLQTGGCSNIEICTNSCETFPNCHTCDINSLLDGFSSCTPPFQGSVLDWPEVLCHNAGVPHNISWYSFVAGHTSICIEIQPTNCDQTTGAIGLQAGVYDFCEDLGGECIGGDANCSNGLEAITFDVDSLELGKIYYIFVDGCNGAICHYNMTVCENTITEFDPEVELSENACPDEVIKIAYYMDVNQNDVKDVDEELLNLNSTNEFITLSPSSNLIGIADNIEHYLVDAGTYTVSFDNDLFLPNSIPSTIEIVADQGEVYYEIGLVPNPNNIVYNLDLEVTSNEVEVCDQEVTFSLKLSNRGNVIVDQSAILQFHPSLEFVEADHAPTSETDSTLTWQTGSLEPFSDKIIYVTFLLPDASLVGEILCLETKSEDNTKSNSSKHCFELLCSFDPNDKHGTPFRGDENYTLFDEVLKYNIRFENLGNYYAKNIRIEDKLSEHLDYNSFEVLQSSHPINRFYINGEGILKIFFDDINLASIEMDSVLNKGFVQFSISSKSGLAENTILNNTASIFFDQNEAVVTNTTTHTLVSVLPFSSSTYAHTDSPSINIFPNPAYSIINFEDDVDLDQFKEINILDINGQKLYTHKSSDRQIDIKDFSKGLYFIEYTSLKGEKNISKFIKI